MKANALFPIGLCGVKMAKSSFLVFLFLFAIATNVAAYYDGIVIDDASREIDLASQVVKISVKTVLANRGGEATNVFLVAVPSAIQKHLSYIKVEDALGNDLAIQATDSNSPGAALYQVTLAKSLEPKATSTVWVYSVFTHSLVPFPAEISQADPQLVKYIGSAYLFSPYKVAKQKTKVTLASQQIEFKTEVRPTSVQGDVITYGPYTDKDPFTETEIVVHFENSKPFVAVTRLLKDLEVSAWGNLAVEETYSLRQAGAKHKGVFSRFDYQKNPAANGVAAVRSVSSVIPASASDIYYRDYIGNISTSHVFGTERGVEVELVPRFPLFGGWKTTFCYGYNLPVSDFLRTRLSKSSSYVLTFPFSTSLENVVVDDIVVKVILPDGASNIKAHVPFEVSAVEYGTYTSWLDFVSRPTIIIKKSNLVAEHNVNFQVSFDYSILHILRKPLLLTLLFFSFFVACMAYVRFELPISKDAEYAAKEIADKANDVLRRFRSLKEQREERYEAVQKVHDAFIADKKKKEAYDEEEGKTKAFAQTNAAELQKLITEMQDVDRSKADKMTEVLKKEKDRHEKLFQLYGFERANKTKKNTVTKDTVNKLQDSIAQLRDDIEELLAELGDE